MKFDTTATWSHSGLLVNQKNEKLQVVIVSQIGR